jgi:hypothetical protein
MHLRRGLESSGVATNGAAQYAFLFRTAFCYGPIRYTEGAYVDSPGGVFSHQSRVVVDSRSGTQPLHLSVLLLALHVSSG